MLRMAGFGTILLAVTLYRIAIGATQDEAQTALDTVVADIEMAVDDMNSVSTRFGDLPGACQEAVNLGFDTHWQNAINELQAANDGLISNADSAQARGLEAADHFDAGEYQACIDKCDLAQAEVETAYTHIWAADGNVMACEILIWVYCY